MLAVIIPSFVLLAILIVAWKWELIGGIMLAAIGLVMSPFILILNHGSNHFSIGASIGAVLMITFPFIIVGVLFIISHYLKKKNLSKVA
jgi:hypothetical protein